MAESRELRVFLCHASQDKPVVRELYQRLLAEGWIDPWLDEEKLLPGQDWGMEIEKAVEDADVVLVFLSSNSVTKEGYVQKELRLVLDIALEKPEGTIFVIPLKLDDCKVPRKLHPWQYVDYSNVARRKTSYSRLRKSLLIRFDQRRNSGDGKVKAKAKLARKLKPKVIPTDSDVEIMGWVEGSLPTEYAFIGENDAPPVPHFYRERDQHVSVLFDSATPMGESFLIDKYAITCVQYCKFLNELIERDIIQVRSQENECHAIHDGHILAVDSLDRWKKSIPGQTWLHANKPFGITYHNEQWKPLLESELCPVTLVTWWGARLYSLWVHNLLGEPVSDNLAYLPTPAQWLAAATWDSSTRGYRRYPWGDSWDFHIVNFSGYHIGRNVIDDEWNVLWANNSLAYGSAHLLPVAELPQNRSPVGCIQMIGNVWEWTSGILEARMVIKGGCAVSPMEHCLPTWESKRAITEAHEYIGFRCCYPFRRFL